MEKNKKKPWRKISQRYVYEHYPFIKIRRDSVIQPDDKKGKYTVAERPDSVTIIAEKKDKEFYLVEQWRYPLDRKTLEFPSGGVKEGENSKAAAIRELAEELGLKALYWKKIGEVYPSPSFIRNKNHIFLAKKLKKVKYPADATEQDIKIHIFSYEKIVDMITTEKIKDIFLVSALWYYKNNKK
jgi:8-oxo-dGTP pyrophosphatase MutT (NUDIX family)